MEHIYEVPLEIEREGLPDIVIEALGLEDRVHEPDLAEWIEMVEKLKNLSKTVNIAIVGKYVELPDAYISVNEALKHAGIVNDTRVNIKYVNAEMLEGDQPVAEFLSGVDGILVPGGFGDRGIEGKIRAIQYARENEVPCFGICLGMQCAVIEFARNVAGLKDANSSEFNPSTENPVIDLMPEQKGIDNLGGTMRLGSYPCKVMDNTITGQAYGEEVIYERHRHRYEFNNEYRNRFEELGMVFAGISPDGRFVEIIELKDHPWFVGVQFHPEFKSRPNRPHPLFVSFIKAGLARKDKVNQ